MPGWGQRYKGESKKGWAFTGLAAGLVTLNGATALASNTYASQYRNLENGDFEGHYNRWNTAYAVHVASLVGTGLFWIYNSVDAGFSPVSYLAVKDAEVHDVFPAIHRRYATAPLGYISVQNRSDEALQNIRAMLHVPGYMDVPVQGDSVEAIPPGGAIRLNLKAAFNEKIFGVSEPSPAQGKIEIEYEMGRKKRKLTRTVTFTVYNRNAIVWDDPGKVAAFITAKDQVVSDFARTAITNKQAQIASIPSVSHAAAIFNAMGAHGLSYVADPRTPFRFVGGNAEAVDYTQYPVQMLSGQGSRTGDCDDLVVAYAAMLENVGISTAVADVPGHVFLLFDSGASADEIRELYPGDAVDGEPYLLKDGKAWIPVEVTMVGKPFHEAWRRGAAQLQKFVGLGQLKSFAVASAWDRFPPSPPAVEVEVAVPGTKAAGPEVNARFAALLKEDNTQIKGRASAALAREVRQIRQRLNGAKAENEIGVLYARAGQLDKAKAQFRTAIRQDRSFFNAYNNMGNLFYLEGKTRKAIQWYEKGLNLSGDHAGILINLATLYYESGNGKKAQSLYERAVRLDPLYQAEYAHLATAGDTEVAQKNGENGNKASAEGVRDPRHTVWIR
jgi:hypothetical protein